MNSSPFEKIINMHLFIIVHFEFIGNSAEEILLVLTVKSEYQINYKFYDKFFYISFDLTSVHNAIFSINFVSDQSILCHIISYVSLIHNKFSMIH